MRLLSVWAGLALAFVSACSSPERSGYGDLAKHHDTSEPRRGGDDARLISLADSLAPLRDRFNADKGKPRLLALLSPTCGGCVYAARGVVESAINGYPNADISVIIVWMPMLPSDNETAAREASGMFDDARVQQLGDANRRSGIALSRDAFPRWIKDAAEALPPGHMLSELLESRADTPPEKRPLWDLALFYGKGIEWKDGPPKPDYWAKQIAYYGRQADGTSGLFWRNDFGKEPVASDWLLEVSPMSAEWMTFRREEPDLPVRRVTSAQLSEHHQLPPDVRHGGRALLKGTDYRPGADG